MTQQDLKFSAAEQGSKSGTTTMDQAEIFYEIKVKGQIDRCWSEWFDDLTISLDEEGYTTLSGPVADQAALHGLLIKIRDLALPLLSLYRLEPNR